MLAKLGVRKTGSRPEFNQPAKKSLGSCPVVAATKPQLVPLAFIQKSAYLHAGDAVHSTVAKVALEEIRACHPDEVSAFRAMPNLGVSLCKGTISLSIDRTAETRISNLRMVLERIGTCFELPESKFDVVTAVVGSGLAYFFSWSSISQFPRLIGV